LLLLRLGQRSQQLADLLLRARVQRREGAFAGRGEAEVHLAGVVLRTGRLDQAALLEAAEQAAEVTRVELEAARELGGGGARAVRKLPQQARFGQREACVEQAFVQHADAPGVEAVEGADRFDALGAGVDRGRHRPIIGQMVAKGKQLVASIDGGNSPPAARVSQKKFPTAVDTV
jgi:hypothetical protein